MNANGQVKAGRPAYGFTLIELVIAMLVFAVAMTFFISLIVPHSTRSIDPIFQAKAAKLGQSLIGEISRKRFDENSNTTTGERCGETLACTLPSDLGSESESRDVYDDVDDFNGLDQSNGNILNSTAGAITIAGKNIYQGFRATVSVFYDADLNGTDDNTSGNTKAILVSVTTPNNETLVFTSYRYNY
jgi:MSHA pilin protein MshD